jgi:hypothetical protein
LRRFGANLEGVLGADLKRVLERVEGGLSEIDEKGYSTEKLVKQPKSNPQLYVLPEKYALHPHCPCNFVLLLFELTCKICQEVVVNICNLKRTRKIPGYVRKILIIADRGNRLPTFSSADKLVLRVTDLQYF